MNEWFFVTFDAKSVCMRAEPPGKLSWSQKFDWDAVIRVCFKAEDYWSSDGIYVFTKDRPESYLIPIEAQGGGEIWDEILRRNLFDATLAGKAMAATEGLFCWPPPEQPAGTGRTV